MDRLGDTSKYILQSVAGIGSSLEQMMVEYSAPSLNGAVVDLDDAAIAITVCEVSGIPNPALFTAILRRIRATLAPYPEFEWANGYHNHMVACIIWVLCLLSPQALVRSLARLYHQTPGTLACITIGEVKDMLLDTMGSDPKRATNKVDVSSLTHVHGLFDYHNAVSCLSPEYRAIMSEINGDNSFNDLTMHDDIAVPEDVFVRYFARKHPRALWPLFMIQKQLQHVFLGDKCQKRILVASGAPIPGASNTRCFFPLDLVDADMLASYNTGPPSGWSLVSSASSLNLDKLDLVSCLVTVLSICEEVSSGLEVSSVAPIDRLPEISTRSRN